MSPGLTIFSLPLWVKLMDKAGRFPSSRQFHRSLMEALGNDLSKPGTCGNPEPELAFAVRERYPPL